MLLEGTAKAIGSMAAFGYVNKAVQGIGGAGKIATMIRDASMPISGGLIGGGSQYHQTVSDIMAKSPEDMAKESPRYNEYISMGLSPKDAQIRVAAEAGEYAASIAAPLGAATTMMAPGLEKLPTKVSSVKGAVKSTLFEPVQESIESFDEQLSTNLGKKQVFNPNQDMAEGIGKAVGEGALYGLTSAGVTQAPGVAALGAKAIKDGTSSFVGSMKEKIGALGEDNKNSSPVSDAALATAATTVATQVPAVAATMQAAVKDDPAMQEKVTNFTAIMQSVSTHDAADFDSASDSIKKALTGAVTKIDELTALKSVFNNKDSTDADRDFAGTKLVEELSAVNEFLNTQTDVIDAVQDEPTKKFVRDLKQLAANILSNKEFLATRNDVATRLAEKHKTSQPELAINADPTSQEGKQAIAETLAVASTLPTEVNEKAVEAILKHSERGSLKLTPTQKANLEISKAAIAALQDDLVEGTELMRVSTEAANAYEAGSKGKSAIQHATDIVRTISEGNISLAKTLLKSFERFAQHYQNKAEAVNQATQEGNDQDYKAEYRQLAYGQWLKEKALYTFQKSGRGVELATQVHKEARAIGSMYNAIAAMYPDLQLDQVTLTEPDPIFLPNGKFDHKVTQHGIGGNGVAGITAYRNRLSIQQSKGAKNGQGQKEKVLTTPPTEVGSGSTQQPTTVSPIGQEAVVTKGSKAPLTRLFGDVLSNAILNIIDSVNKEAVKNKTLDFDVFLVKFVKDISSIPSTGFDALNKVREQQSNVFESGEFEWTKKEQKFGDVYYYPKKQTKEGIEIEKYVYKTSTYEITRSGPTDTIIFNSPIKFGEFEVKTIYASPGSFKLVSEDYAQQYINNELYVYGKELDIKIGGTNKRNSMVTYRRKSGVRSNGLYATFYENYYKIDPKYRSKNSFPLVFDEKGNNSYSEIVTTNPQTPEARPTNQGAPNGQGQKEKVLIAPVAPVTPTTPPVSTEPTIAEIQERLDTFTDDELRKEWNRIAAIAKPRPEIEEKTAKLIAATLRQRKADDEAAKAALPTQTLDEVFGNDRLEEAKKIAEEKAAYLAEMEKIGAFRSLYYDLRDSVTKRGMFTIAEHRELFKDDNRFNFLRSKKPYVTLDALIPDGRFDAYGISRDYATGIQQIADKLKAGDFLTLADKIRLQEIEVKLAELENIPDEQLNELIALYEAKTKTEAEKTAKQRRDAKSKREARQAASKGGTSTTKINQGEQGTLESAEITPKIGETSTEVKGRFTITKTVVSDNTVLSVHTNNEDGKVSKSEYVTTYPDIYSDELGNKYTVVIYRDSANPSVITDVKSFDVNDKKNTLSSYGKAGNQTDEQYITRFTEAGDVTLEYTDKFEKPLAKVISDKQAPVESTAQPKDKTSFPVSEESKTIYSKLGSKTVSGNVVINKVYQLAGVAYAKSIGAIFSLRVDNSNKHFGNPFSSVTSEIAKGLVATRSTKESVQRYIDWVLSPTTDVNPEQHAWIREQLISGKLKGQPILYYKELNAPSHATALDYLINKHDWVNQATKELVDGTRTPKAVTTSAVNPISAEELDELNTFLAAKKRLTEIITNPSSYAPEVIVAAKKELTELTKERAKQVDYLFDGFPDESVELDFLSNVAPSLIANTAGKLERLWELRNKLGKLFADLGVSKLLSTAGNILIAGTKPVSKERVSQFIDRPFDTFVQIVNEKKDLKDNEKELRAALAEHITLRANLLKLGVERIVLDKVNSDNNLIKLLQLNHLDSLGNSSKHRVDLFPENRLFSLLAPVGKGDTPEVRLDPYLMETASLAFMQWMLSAADRKAVVDEKTVANILGIDENVVTEAQIAEYSERITNIEAIDAISAGIMRHWSLKPKDNIQVGYSEGVARVLAKEMLDVAVSKEVIEAGFGLNHNQVRVDLTKTVDSYGVDKLPKTIKLANAIFPDLIDNTAFIENEQVMYIGENVTVPVSKTILREPNQLLTPEQIRAQDNNQKTIHRIDESSYKLFMGIGAKGVFDILSLPEETDSLNVGHAKSIIGKKQGISAVFTKMEEVYQRVSNQAVDGDVHGVPIHYKFEYTSTNRLQMIGSHTPQASKWMRNVVLPTHGTIDATYGNTGHTLLMLSVAQNLGVSIQNRSNQTNIDEITAKLNGELADVVNLLKDRINNNEDAVSPKLMAALKSAFGSKFTPSALYALHEYARYLATSDADKKNFNTGLYIEADGVNNGPAAALIMLGGAVELTRKFFTNAARVGYFIGSADRTLNQQRQEDSTGLYEAGAQVLPTFLKTFRDNAAGFVIPEGEFTPAIKLDEYFDHVSLMVSSLLPNFSMDEDGNYAIGRSVIKNPLTKTVYGSGSRGMGNGLLKDMLEALYEKLSIVKLYEDSGMSLDQSFVAVFGEQYQDLFDSMDQLARHNVEIERGQFVVKNVIIPDHLFQNENYLKFEVSGAAFTSMSNNINTFFSKQVKDAITDVMSPAVMDSAQLLARATSFRTEFMAYEFNKLYEAALAKRKNSDHLYRQADGLSNDELRAITNKLSKIFPYIKTTTQSFNPVGRSKVSNDNFIGVTSTQYKVTPSVFIPESAGVSGVPYMIIGLGDGRTIQIFSDGGPEDTLNIYDGIHMGLGKAEEYSKRANSAVWDAWQQGNPFGALFPSLSSFVSNYDWTSFVAAYKSEPEKIKPILAALRVKSIIGLPEHIANLLNNVSTSAKNIDATHQVLGEYKATIDQLASIGSPYVKPGADIVIDDASIAEINSKISSIVRASTNYPVSGIVEGIAVKFNVPVPTKPVKYDLKSFIKKGGAANKTATIQSLMLTGLLNNVSVEYGPLSSFGGKLTRDDYGGYDPKSNTIYIVSDKSGAGIETLTHEMIHAATFRAIANHYADPSNSAIANEVARLEALMESFLNRAALSKDETVRDIFVKISGINNRSVKLNEFMAYGLSNPAMRADLASVNALKLSENIIDKYVGKIKQLIERILEIFGVKAQRTQYDQLVFNTVYVMAGGNDTAISNGQVLKMSISGLGTNDRLSKVTDFFVSSLAKHIKDQLDPAFANLPPKALHTKNPGEFTRASRLGLQVASLISSKFNATPQEQVALNMIVQTLATGAQMDGNIMSGVEELYTHFTKNLTVEDFLLVEPSAATQADTYEANEMYNLVMGNYTTAKDVYGRGQTLPIFFALGLVNDRFRAVLAKKGLPDALKIASTDTDTFLTSSANILLSKMDKALTGTSKSTNTQQALDSIFSVLVQNGTDSLTLVGAGLNKTGSVVDGLNDRVVSAIEYVSAKLDAGADKVLAASPNKAVQAVGNVTKNIALAMNENTAARVGEFAVSLSNQSNLFKPLQSLIADFVGRTDSNKLLYDMIKFVRSSVQQDRQHYREELPSVLAAQFTRKLSDKEWTHLFTGLAKTDLAQLVDLIGIKETVALLSEPTKISDRISTLEANLRNQVPTSWPKLQKKAKQLANYMMTGEYGPMLMRNADILQLNFGGNRDEIDSLVTLYALQKLEQPVKDTLLSLVQTQKTGIDTLVSYLSGQRKDDIHPNAAVRLNVYKGYIPSLQNESVSLRIVSDTEHAAMLEKGYIRTGTYAGSIIEPRASSSYYFLNAPARAAFSQGLIQNVHNTSGGIDTRTMFSTGLVAGRITDPRLVNKLAPYLNSDVAGNENLLPIFDETGAIVALERGARPDQLVQLKQNTHLAKMIGVWRGRQVEEHKARAINAALVPRFKQMYSDDLAKNPATAREYINLFDSKDPIHIDAIKLMPVYMRKALESEFGKDTFMVRKDMVDSAIGYRTPSVGDAWTGVSGWSPESLEMAKRVTMTVFGNKSYEYLVNAEQMLKNAIQDVKLIIVVKSVIVPVGNMLSNVIQLMARGVPIKDIVRNIPKKISEVTFYTKQRLRKIELEVALRAAEGNNDVVGIRKAKNELETIEDSFRRLSIWPLINAGEFSAISDVGIARDDIVLSEGRLHTYMENLVDKLPEGVRTAAKYGLVAKDTALFQGLQKAVEYGDFLAKAIEYDYLIGSKKLSKEDSLARISEEFVNYDLLMGRFREYAENIGLVWFTAFKVRSTKIAASIIRNNPFHALMSTLPHSYMPAGTGSPITDNGVAKVLSGDIWYSLGFGQALRAPALNPWVNLAH